MARKISTAMGLVLVIVLGAMQVADASATPDPKVYLDCDHGTTGCAGMAGEFATADGSTVDSVDAIVREVRTGDAVDVTSRGCAVSTRDDLPAVVRMQCMIEATTLGITGNITWSVLLNGSEVWTSAATPTECTPPATTTPPAPGGATPPETTTTTTTAPSAAPETPTTTTTTATTIPDQQSATDTTIVTAVSSTAGPPPSTTTSTTVVTLVSPAASEPPAGTTADEEILPVTGLSLGVIGGIGAVLLLVGLAIEVRTRPERA